MQEIVLGLGFNYIPLQPLKFSVFKKHLSTQLTNLTRLLHLQCYYFDNNINYNLSTPQSSLLPHPPSTWTPQLPRFHQQMISTFINNLKLKVLSHFRTARTMFTSTDQTLLSIIKEIASIPDIVIKPADKNLGLVIMDANDYTSMCLEHLDNNVTYERINNSDIFYDSYHQLEIICIKYNFRKKINNYGKPIDHEVWLSLAQLQNSRTLRIAPFYCLPKIHKMKGQYVPGRPIASAPSTSTYHTSRFLHNILHPIVKTLPTICLSSYTVIQDLKTRGYQFGSTSVIVTADVTSLYPNIPTIEGIKSVEQLLNEINFNTFPISFIIELLSWVLENNFISFNRMFYRQKSGTAMGTPVAPAYAQIFLHMIERDLIHQSLFYKRYIDDIFAIFPSETAAINFITAFNNSYPTIQLEAVSIAQTGIFLDIEFNLSMDGTLSHKLFQKPMNKYSYIPPTSNHNKKMFIAWITEELNRYKRLCTYHADFLHAASLLHSRLIRRGYNTHMFALAFQRATRATLDPLPTASEFNPNPNINPLPRITKIWLPLRTTTLVDPFFWSHEIENEMKNISHDFYKEFNAFRGIKIIKSTINDRNINSLLVYYKNFVKKA
jgi:Reverse transcriptase (RNA-dependent DNA polymerase)